MNTTYWLNKIMDKMYTSGEDTFYVGLSSSQPNKDGTGVSEPNGNNYARVQITAFTAPENGVIKNTVSLEFPRSTGVWFDTPKAAYWVLFDGSDSSANVISSGELDEPKSIESNTIVTIAENTLSITLTDYSPEASV